MVNKRPDKGAAGQRHVVGVTARAGVDLQEMGVALGIIHDVEVRVAAVAGLADEAARVVQKVLAPAVTQDDQGVAHALG